MDQFQLVEALADRQETLTEPFPVGYLCHWLAGRTRAAAPWRSVTVGHHRY